MNNVFKDKIFLAAILIATFASGIFVARKVAHFVNASQVQTPVQAHSHPSAVRHTYTPVSRSQAVQAPTQRTVASNDHTSIPVHRARPKNGSSWLVGTSSEADSNDLKAVLRNAENNDIVQLEAGSYEMNVSDVAVEKLQINGRDNVSITYHDSYDDVVFKDLVFRDLQLDFSKVKYNSARFSAYDAKMTFERVKAFGIGNHFRMVFSGNIEFIADFCEFKGVTLNLEGSSKAKITNSVLEKTQYLFDMEGSSELDISKSTLQHFEWSAFQTQSPSVKITGEDLTVMYGREAFYGKFTAANTNIQKSKFKNLRNLHHRNSEISCYMCEKDNIQE